MPQVPQEELTPIYAWINITIEPADQPPTFTGKHIPVQFISQADDLTYQGYDSWHWEPSEEIDDIGALFGFYWYRRTTARMRVDIALDWEADNINIALYTEFEDEGFWEQNDFAATTKGCERGSPWFLNWTTLNPTVGKGQGKITAWRPVPGTPISKIPPPFQPQSLLKNFTPGAPLKGPFGNQTLSSKPTYPAGAIPGITPATGSTPILRAQATGRVHTDQGHVRSQATFATAATQWQALTEQERQAWNAAGRTCKPPLSGIALWTQITHTKRLDRIPTLEARTGLTLPKPTLLP